MSLQNGNRTVAAVKKNLITAKLLNILLTVIVVVLSVSLLGNSMTKEVGHDEHMYCTAGCLTAQGKMIYRDFSYVAQLPCHPLILGLLYKVTGTSYYLLVGRLFSVACEIGILICIVGICKSILKKFPLWAAGFAISAVLIYAMNPFVIYASGYAWNHSAVILCVLVCLRLFAKLDLDKMNFGRLSIIGALLTLATFMRPTTALVYVVFAVVIIFMAPGRLKKGKATALPFIIGSFVLGLWPLILMSKAPEAFFLNLVKIPALNAAFLRQNGWVYNKAQLTKAALLSPAYIMLIVLGIYLLAVRFVSYRAIPGSDKRRGLFFAAIAAAFVATVFIPPTMWIQYWAAPVAFIIVALAYPVNYLCGLAAGDMRKERYVFIAAILVIIATGTSLYGALPSAVSNFVNVFDGRLWVPLRVHRISQDIGDKANGNGPVLTLSPLYAIEGGREIYRQFSAGPFVYRIADKLNDSQKRIVHAAGPDELKKLIETQPPSAVIVGTEPMLLEEPILKQIVGANWQKEDYGQNGPVVYFRKSGDQDPARR